MREGGYINYAVSQGPPSKSQSGFGSYSSRRSCASMRSWTGGCLNETQFAAPSHVPLMLSAWRHDCNHVRPRSEIGGLTPADATKRVAPHRPEGHPINRLCL